jgi:hypothetical protein
VASPTTAAPRTDEEQALAVLEGTYAVWRECLRDVPSCDRSTFVEYFTGPLLANRRDLLDEWQANGYEVRSVDSYTYEVLEVSLDFAIPHVVVCETDAATLVQPSPDGTEVIIQEGYVERIREVHLAQTPLGWRAEGFATREQVEDEVGALCS